MQELERYQNRVEDSLKSHLLQRKNKMPSKLFAALNYATLNGGKRLRPALCYAVGEALGLKINHLDIPACALELIHSYSLVHDDLPAMDDDALRRGQPTCHIKFDEATAILVGDAQQTLAFEILASSSEISSEHRIMMLHILTQAAGATGMVAGQMIDMESEQQSIDMATLLQLHQLKTGALIEASLLLGAVMHPKFSQFKSHLSALGQILGLAFQIQDDILDLVGDSHTLGKESGRDQALNKSTFISLLGLEAAKSKRNQLIKSALEHQQALPFASDFLDQLIHYVAQRNH